MAPRKLSAFGGHRWGGFWPVGRVTVCLPHPKPPTPQQVGRAGELFVAAELNRRGALATLYLTNTPRVDVVALSPDGKRTVSIQVKTKGPRSASWQWDLNKARAEQHAAESDYMVLVDLAPAHPAYYVCPLSEVARHCLARSSGAENGQHG